MKLIIQNDNYADEFNIQGFMTVEDEWVKNWEEGLKDFEYPYDMYFGSNEFITYNSPKEIMDSVGIVDITPEQEDVLIALFAPHGGVRGRSIQFGTIKLPEY